MPKPLEAAKRLQVLALRKAGKTYREIGTQLSINADTAMRVVARQGARLDTARIADREEILERMTSILQSHERPADRIAAGKLIAVMQGYLTPEQGRAASVNISFNGPTDVKILELEYKQLTGHELGGLSEALNLGAPELGAGNAKATPQSDQPQATDTQ